MALIFDGKPFFFFFFFCLMLGLNLRLILCARETIERNAFAKLLFNVFSTLTVLGNQKKKTLQPCFRMNTYYETVT